VVLSIAAAGGLKNYLDQISTPEGALQVALELFVLHATVRSSSGGPPRPVTIKGKIEKAGPGGLTVRITDLPNQTDHPALQGGRAANDPHPDVSNHPAVQGGRAANNTTPPNNVYTLPRPKPLAVPSQRVVGQDFDSSQGAQHPNVADANRPSASTSGGRPSLKDVTGGPRNLDEHLDELGDVNAARPARQPSERQKVTVDPRTRGFAIEREHLDSLPDFSRPKEHNFPGIDAWRGGRQTPANPKPGEAIVISGADVLQVKSVGSLKDATRMSKGTAALEGSEFKNQDGSIRVINPRSRTLDILFEQDALPNGVDGQTRQALTEQSSAAGAMGILIRWFRYGADGKKVKIPIP
jgi:hypothetical protein